eukprot:CAMPEP_0115668454 /NCGR_PEP_ID=MMETSP0272-20121206/50475_1 /TAXON_ID=71861 /ORGANISM="Scrippsiella trochoidea, Strain CCMP3099" /LENGTH=38 /DNA_ID= /DNA_START= /DNA_END= /DNA_ORIENTATION=
MASAQAACAFRTSPSVMSASGENSTSEMTEASAEQEIP